MPLTKDQQQAADEFFQFLLSDEKEFIISGGAGVGKSYLLSHLHKDVMERYAQTCTLVGVPQKYKRAVFTATTNKAAEVLEKSIKEHVSTVHSYLGLRVQDDYSTGKTVLTKTSAYGPKKNVILFIDECSTINAELLSHIRECMHDSKIVYVGDHAQMAPVNEKLSQLYHSPVPFVYLKEVIRNAGTPALVHLCAQLRETVETGVFYALEGVPGVVDFLSAQQMQTELIQHFSNPTGDARILCYTNERVQLYNSFLRQARGQPEHFQAGETVVVAKNIASGQSSISVERQVTITKIDSVVLSAAIGDGISIKYREAEISYGYLGVASFHKVRIPEDPIAFQNAMKTLARTKQWSNYFQAKAQYADLRGMDACTVYKSQGSTYHTVFVDLEDIGSSYDASQVARMLFVAASRPTHRVCFYGNLPERYRGKEFYHEQVQQSAAV